MTATPRLRSSLDRLFAVLGLIIVAGCASKPEPAKPKVNRDPNLLVVYGGCALKPMLESAQAAFTTQNSGKSVTLVLDQPAKLVERIKSGAVPDIVVFPGSVEIGILEGDGLLDGSSRLSFGAVKAVIMVPSGNPAAIHGPDDLLSSKVRTIAVPTPGITSSGSDAKRELERIGLWPRLQHKLSFKLTPLDALQALSSRSVDAAVLYDPCPRLAVGGDIAPGSVEAVSTLTPEGASRARVCAELHKQSPNALLAQRFLKALTEQGSAPVSPQPKAPSEAGAAPG